MANCGESESPGQTQRFLARIAELEQDRDILKQIVDKSPPMVSIEQKTRAVQRRQAGMQQEVPGREDHFWRLFESNIIGIAVVN